MGAGLCVGHCGNSRTIPDAMVIVCNVWISLIIIIIIQPILFPLASSLRRR